MKSGVTYVQFRKLQFVRIFTRLWLSRTSIRQLGWLHFFSFSEPGV